MGENSEGVFADENSTISRNLVHVNRKRPERGGITLKKWNQVSCKQYNLDQSFLIQDNALRFMWAQEVSRKLQLYRDGLRLKATT